jgi:hypothetical protein
LPASVGGSTTIITRQRLKETLNLSVPLVFLLRLWCMNNVALDVFLGNGFILSLGYVLLFIRAFDTGVFHGL